jgi:DNA-binding XRE family transcriptional regulator
LPSLRELREDRLLRQDELARKAKVSLRTISNIESGRHKPRVTTKRKLLRYFGIRYADWRQVFPG